MKKNPYQTIFLWSTERSLHKCKVLEEDQETEVCITGAGILGFIGRVKNGSALYD